VAEPQIEARFWKIVTLVFVLGGAGQWYLHFRVATQLRDVCDAIDAVAGLPDRRWPIGMGGLERLSHLRDGDALYVAEECTRVLSVSEPREFD